MKTYLLVDYDTETATWFSAWWENDVRSNKPLWVSERHQCILDAYQEAVKWACQKGPDDLCDAVISLVNTGVRS